MTLNFNGFRDGECVFQLDARIPNRIVHPRLPKQKSHTAQIVCFPLDLSCFGSPHRMRSVGVRLKANGRRPFPDDPLILAGRDARALMDSSN